jgi:AraC-like DNA-binding protein
VRPLREAIAPLEVPSPGAIAWLDVSAENPDTWSPPSNRSNGRRRTGPLGMEISPLRHARVPYMFKGARLRGTRCIWSASTVSGAELFRPARTSAPAPFDQGVHIVARLDGTGSVFEPGDAANAADGTMRVFEPADEIAEQFLTNTHLFTLNIPLAAIGVESSAVREMSERIYDLTPFHTQLLRAAVGLIQTGGDELTTSASLIGVDRYLAALAGLMLRTAVRRPSHDLAQVEQLRIRTDAIILEHAADPNLTPATIAAELNISLRQLYRAFTGTESPAARIRRRRLERAAEILATRSGPGQVERVAVECGFASAEYFSRAFRREFGLSPRAYRAAHRDSTRGIAPPQIGPAGAS